MECLKESGQPGRPLIVFDESRSCGEKYIQKLHNQGYKIEKADGSDYCLYPLLWIDIKNEKEKNRLLQILELMGYEEHVRELMILYLILVRAMESSGQKDMRDIDIDAFLYYGDTDYYEMKMNQIISEKKVNERQKMQLIRLYGKAADAADDFADFVYKLRPYISGRKYIFEVREPLHAFWFPIYRMVHNPDMGKIVRRLVEYNIEDLRKEIKDIAVVKIEDEEVKCIDFLDKQRISKV